jgi:WD40 repeat protein
MGKVAVVQIWSTAYKTDPSSVHGGEKYPTSLSHTSTTSPAIHSLVYSPNGTYLASRSMDDDTVRVWTAQSLSNSSIPCHICVGNLVCLNEFTNCAFRPDGNMLCAGTLATPRSRNESEEQASRRPDSYSRLKFYSLEKQNVSRRLGGIPERSNLSSTSSTNVESLYRSPVLDVPIVEGVSIGKVLWHPKLNQIFLGLSDGRYKS